MQFLIVLFCLIGHCLSELFGRYLEPFASTLTTSFLFFFFFSLLFFVGSPYLSLNLMLICFILYNWYYTMPIINSILFLLFHAFIIIVCIFVQQTNIIIIILFAIQLSFCLLVVTACVSLYNNKMVSFLKKSFILLGFYMLLLGLYLAIIKIYFLDVIWYSGMVTRVMHAFSTHSF